MVGKRLFRVGTGISTAFRVRLDIWVCHPKDSTPYGSLLGFAGFRSGEFECKCTFCVPASLSAERFEMPGHICDSSTDLRAVGLGQSHLGWHEQEAIHPAVSHRLCREQCSLADCYAPVWLYPNQPGSTRRVNLLLEQTKPACERPCHFCERFLGSSIGTGERWKRWWSYKSLSGLRESLKASRFPGAETLPAKVGEHEGHAKAN